MPKLKKKLGILLTIFSLTSCQHFPRVEPQERCVITIKHDACFCHLYDLMRDKRLSETVEHPPQYCEKLVGFRPDAWAEIKLWLIDVKWWLGIE